MAVMMPTNSESPAGACPPQPTELAGDVLLLLRLVLKDGEMNAAAEGVLRRVAWRAFAIDAAAFETFLPAFRLHGEKGADRLRAALRARPKGERRLLAAALAAAALKDDALVLREERLRARTAAILDLGEDETG